MGGLVLDTLLRRMTTDIHLDGSRGREGSLISRSRPEDNPLEPTAKSSLSDGGIATSFMMVGATPKVFARACRGIFQRLCPEKHEGRRQ